MSKNKGGVKEKMKNQKDDEKELEKYIKFIPKRNLFFFRWYIVAVGIVMVGMGFLIVEFIKTRGGMEWEKFLIEFLTLGWALVLLLKGASKYTRAKTKKEIEEIEKKIRKLRKEKYHL